MAKIILIRHASSVYSEKGLWAGRDDTNLSERGEREAAVIADQIAGRFSIHRVFTSDRKRCIETWNIIAGRLGFQAVPVVMDASLNERDWGDYTGENKQTVRAEVGAEQFRRIRLAWEEPIPGGETLRQVYERVMPFVERTIIPVAEQGQNVLIITSHCPFRSIEKYFERISDDAMIQLEAKHGEVHVYDISTHGEVRHKEILIVPGGV